jgi:hypothetical protein
METCIQCRCCGCSGRRLGRQSGTPSRRRLPSTTGGMQRPGGWMTAPRRGDGMQPPAAISGMPHQGVQPADGMPHLRPVGWAQSRLPGKIAGMRRPPLAGYVVVLLLKYPDGQLSQHGGRGFSDHGSLRQRRKGDPWSLFAGSFQGG